MSESKGKAKVARTNGRRTKSAESPAANAVSKGSYLEVQRMPGETEDRAVVGMVGRGLVTNASTALRFLQGDHGDLSLMDMVTELRDQGGAINRGDFAVTERMLNAQAVALNTMFAELARRAAMNFGAHLGASESYMRLAFKAQAQCRATVETLAAMKNPPVVFTRQMNVAAGPQQVNNGQPPNSAPAGTHAGETAFRPNELLEDLTHGGTQLDSRATAAAGGKNPSLESMGAVNRAPKRRGQG